jgi:hypothetical protein
VFVLFKDRRSFFELDTNPTSEEIESLRKARITKIRYHICKFKFAGDR